MDEVQKILEGFGVPFAYDHFAEGEVVDPPFICYRMPDTDNFSADGIVYLNICYVNIELYTDRKDPDLERKLENLLTEAGIFFDKDETWIESEKLYETVFAFEVSGSWKK